MDPESVENETSKTIHDFLPVPGSRNAKWWDSTFHIVTSMVGGGIFSLPYAMVYLGWYWGTIFLVASWVITLFTYWQLIELHEYREGKRFDRYHELGQEAFGPVRGLWIVVPQQLIVEVGIGIVFMVTGGHSLHRFYGMVCIGGCYSISPTQWIIIFGCIQLILSQLPNFNSLARVSLAAAIMSLCFSVFTIVYIVIDGRVDYVSYDLPPENSTADNVFGVFNALGVIAFAYAGHNIALEIQSTIPSTAEKPSKVAMWRGVLLAYVIVALCYLGVSVAGYYAYGNIVTADILKFIRRRILTIDIARLLLFIHTLGSYQVYTMPVFDMIEYVLYAKLKLSPRIRTRIISRSLYVALTCFIGCTIPFFNDLLGFIGGFAFVSTTFFLPCIIWLKIMKPKIATISWFANWLFIVLGILLMMVTCIGGLRKIIVNAADYRFYSNRIF